MPASMRMRHLLTLPLLALTILAASFALGPVTSASASSHEGKVLRAARIATQQIGDPYRYGGDGPNAFDCSGLIDYSFKKAGMPGVPRTSSAQARAAHRIKKSQLRKGDLMFFTDGGGIYHAAIFLQWKHGKAQMLHSPRSGERVKRATPWTSSWYAATLRR